MKTRLVANTVADEVHVRVTWECAGCKATATSSFMAPVFPAPQIKLPAGWSLALGSTYCPRHKVDVSIGLTNLLEMPPLETRT
jgi:hypothetical protein